MERWSILSISCSRVSDFSWNSMSKPGTTSNKYILPKFSLENQWIFLSVCGLLTGAGIRSCLQEHRWLKGSCIITNFTPTWIKTKSTALVLLIQRASSQDGQRVSFLLTVTIYLTLGRGLMDLLSFRDFLSLVNFILFLNSRNFPSPCRRECLYSEWIALQWREPIV